MSLQGSQQLGKTWKNWKNELFSNSQGKPEKHRENKEKEWKNIEKSGKFLNPDIYIFSLGQICKV